MKKGYITLIIICLTSLASFANNIKSSTIKGKVVDTQGLPIAGAKVMLLETQTEVYTDFDGEFVLNKSKKDIGTIEISMISYKAKKSVLDLSKLDNKTLSIKLYSK
jgi:hypothetical protein